MMLLAGDIKGINIEIGGNTTKLTNALKNVDAQSKATQKELKEIDKASLNLTLQVRNFIHRSKHYYNKQYKIHHNV